MKKQKARTSHTHNGQTANTAILTSWKADFMRVSQKPKKGYLIRVTEPIQLDGRTILNA